MTNRAPALTQGRSDLALEFLCKFAPAGPWALVAIGPETGRVTVATFFPRESDACAAWIEERNGRENLYFHVNDVGGPISKKAVKGNIVRALWLHADVDPRPGENLQEERERARKMLTEGYLDIPPADVVTFSGGGYQGFWRLAEPVPIGGIGPAEDFERHNRAIEIALGADHCHNVDRVMRLPGTVNLPNAKKREKGRVPELAVLVRFEPTSHALSEFKKAPAKSPGPTPSEPTSSISNVLPLDSLEQLNDYKVPHRIKDIVLHGHLREIEGPKSNDDSRSAWLLDCLCGLARAGVPEELQYSIITDSRWKVSESVLDKGRSSARYALRQVRRAADMVSDPLLAEMNDAHAVLGCEGAKARVLSYMPPTPGVDGRRSMALQTFEDFRKRYLNRLVEIGRDKHGNAILVDAGKWWLHHPRRRQYVALTFQPGAEAEQGDYLNLWEGFGCEPKPGDWSRLRKHIEEVLAGGDERAAEYIFQWSAWAVQFPDKQAEVALVFRGGKGTGKSTFARALCQLFGQHGLQVSTMDHVSGHFNAHLRDCCLLFADEAYIQGDRNAEAQLKRLITEPTLIIEGKGRDAVPAANHLHVVMASNNHWVAPAGEDERRYAVFDVSDQHKQNREYFRALYDELNGGGLSAMLHDLLGMDLAGWHPRDNVPQTRALQDQKANNLDAVSEWVLTLLQEGRLPDASAPNRTTSAALYRHAQATVPRVKFESLNKLTQRLRKQWRCTPTNNGSARGWEFPPLHMMRSMWEQRYGHWEWDCAEQTEWRFEPPPPF